MDSVVEVPTVFRSSPPLSSPPSILISLLASIHKGLEGVEVNLTTIDAIAGAYSTFVLLQVSSTARREEGRGPKASVFVVLQWGKYGTSMYYAAPAFHDTVATPDRHSWEPKVVGWMQYDHLLSSPVRSSHLTRRTKTATTAKESRRQPKMRLMSIHSPKFSLVYLQTS
jgi:hypothetical protein